MIQYESNEINLAYKLKGKGSTLILLHGFLESTAMWDDIIPYFENSYSILAIDLPGHGESEEPNDSYSIHQVAIAIKNLLKDLNIENPIVLGHSMGGYVALELKKEINTKVILLHSNFWSDGEKKKSDRNRVIELVKTKKNHFIKEAIPNLFSHENVADCSEVINQLIQGASEMTEKSISLATAAMRDREPNYISINGAAIIHGENDPIISTELLGMELNNNQVEAEVYTIENCGHMSIWESKEELINILNHILIQ